MKFKQFLTESTDKIDHLSHVDHVEDHVFHGEDGYHRAHEMLHGVHDRMHGKATTVRVHAQYDGSPSVIFGHHPQTGKFFVGTKAALGKTPKIAHTHADVDKHYPKKSTNQTLHSALSHLQKVAPATGVYQGDVLYTEHSKLPDEDGKAIHFKPNRLLYTAEKKHPDFQKVKDARLGLVVHTKFHGKDLSKMEAGHEPDLHNFGKHKHVHLVNPEVPMNRSLGGDDLSNQFARHMFEVDKEYRNANPETFLDTAVHSTHLKSYTNRTSKSGEKATPQGFKQFLTDRAKEDTKKLKSPKQKLERKDQLVSHLDHIDQHHEKYNSLLNIHHHMQQAKNIIVGGLNKTQEFTVRNPDGTDVQHHGFVATHRGNASRLVNREDG